MTEKIRGYFKVNLLKKCNKIKEFPLYCRHYQYSRSGTVSSLF